MSCGQAPRAQSQSPSPPRCAASTRRRRLLGLGRRAAADASSGNIILWTVLTRPQLHVRSIFRQNARPPRRTAAEPAPEKEGMGATPRPVVPSTRCAAAALSPRSRIAVSSLCVAVPDIVTSAGLLQSIAQDRQLRLVRVCKEDACIGIAGRPGLLLQTRADPGQAHRSARFDQRHSRRRRSDPTSRSA
jgi:hypothetical protein